MRRTDNETIRRMKAEGKTGKSIAEYFGVSVAYICKRWKRIQPVKEPEIFSSLTGKQKKFVLAKAEGKSNTNAAMEAFEVTSRDSAKALGHNLMKDPDIDRAIQEIMCEEGLTRRHVIRRLKELVDCADGNIAIKGIDVANKLSGDYAPEKRDLRLAVGEVRVFKTSFGGENGHDSGVAALQPKAVSESGI